MESATIQKRRQPQPAPESALAGDMIPVSCKGDERERL